MQFSDYYDFISLMSPNLSKNNILAKNYRGVNDGEQFEFI